MKLFTPDLFARAQSADPAVQAEAEHRWEEANDRYEEHLRRIEPELPEHVRSFNDLPLHDAQVDSIARQGDRLVLVLRQDLPPHDLVVLTYTLAGEPFIDKEALPAAIRSAGMAFLYDELEVVREGQGKHFLQSILFSNGWEVRLPFRDVEVTAAETIYPPAPARPRSLSSTQA